MIKVFLKLRFYLYTFAISRVAFLGLSIVFYFFLKHTFVDYSVDAETLSVTTAVPEKEPNKWSAIIHPTEVKESTRLQKYFEDWNGFDYVAAVIIIVPVTYAFITTFFD